MKMFLVSDCKVPEGQVQNYNLPMAHSWLTFIIYTINLETTRVSYSEDISYRVNVLLFNHSFCR